MARDVMEWEIAEQQPTPQRLVDLPRLDQLPHFNELVGKFAVLIVGAEVIRTILMSVSEADMAEHGKEIKEQLQAELIEAAIKYGV
jgi:hypothetical protein